MNEISPDIFQKSMLKSSSLDSRLSPSFPSILPELEKQLLAAKVQLSALKEKGKYFLGNLTSYQDELRKYGEKEIALMRLQREYDIENDTYKMYVKKLEEARISKVMDSEKIANVSVVSYAYSQDNPVKPRKLLVLTIGAFAGLFGGIVLALYAEYSNLSIREPEDVEQYLNLPVLASVRKIKSS